MRFTIEHLSKNYESKQVLRDIDFTFEAGKIYGLLGRNGAGKTTLFNCINGDLRFDSGDFYFSGSQAGQPQGGIPEEAGLPGEEPEGPKGHREEPEGPKRRRAKPEDIGYVLSTPTVPEFLTGREFLKFFLDIHEGDIQEPKAMDRYFEMMGIRPEDQNRLLKDYSHGMKNKMQMLINIIAQPNLLLLDEPLTSLDVVVAEEMKQLLRSLTRDRIIIVSTHIMDLALDLCDEIVLLNHGELEKVDKSNLDSQAFKEKIIEALREEKDD